MFAFIATKIRLYLGGEEVRAKISDVFEAIKI
jgi:hypothetical protein